MPHLQTSAGRVAYSDTGSGPILVLLHATLHDRHDYDSVLPALAASHRVIAVDWPGHGESDAAAGGRQVTAPLLADVLEEVVLERDLRDLRLIGNSVGGFAAARLAIRHPGRVGGLVLVDNGGFVSNPITRTFCRVMGTPAITKRIMPRFVKSYMQPKTPSDHAIVERTVARARTPEGKPWPRRCGAASPRPSTTCTSKLTSSPPPPRSCGARKTRQPPSQSAAPPTSSCRTQSWRSWTPGTLSSPPIPRRSYALSSRS